MRTYEVDVVVDESIRAEYLQWLRAHVREIVALPGFTGATAFERIEPPPAEGECVVCVQYRLVDGAALQDYLREHAPRLRAEGIARFGDRMRASRRVLAPLFEA